MHPARTFAATAGVLVLFNVARGVGLFGDHTDLAALGLLVALAVVAVLGRVDAPTLGLERRYLGAGLRWGLAALALVGVVVAAAAVVPATSGFLDDDRAQVPYDQLLWEVGFGILVATVLPEELAFRGLLLGTGMQAWGPWRGALASSALFGLWHISPTLNTMADNASLDGLTSSPPGQALVVVGNVAVTFVAGLAFCWLRVRSKSLLAPVVGHLATNGVAFVAAWLVRR
ncbi:CPBP family intramembrane glutamic endopeptidase [Rhabdothermincola salaria]|uniref:CPBP family intramembrane glutamic endopeptidase n=1 Tax=Rhabdothermincola salaria TaxID=2903142 RepID=UPI001E5960CC|nr:CPBP family intramembrane glutamic endopeptidase [Rhabdothermincola salaria]MCD9624847.1 CPBP family intramembrane metalloprotease [Rhabdothermincola salaria]